MGVYMENDFDNMVLVTKAENEAKGEGIVFKAMPKYDGMTGIWVKHKDTGVIEFKGNKPTFFASDMHVGEITSIPSKVGGDAIKHQVTMKVTVKPKAYPMPLRNPKSVWGKRMAEKLAQKS
jgi:hypothetical protein